MTIIRQNAWCSTRPSVFATPGTGKAAEVMSLKIAQHPDVVPRNSSNRWRRIPCAMYVCGPTVYNLAHIGNARPVVVFDTLFRLLQTQHGSVVYARNITDIDDKIIKAAQQEDRPQSIRVGDRRIHR